MPHRIVRRRRRFPVAALLIALMIATGPAWTQDGADTPPALLAAARAAGERADTEALVRLTAPSQRARLALETDLAADALAAQESADGIGSLTQAIRLLRNRHGLRMTLDSSDDAAGANAAPEQQQARLDALAQARYGHVDLPAYLGELSALMLASPAFAGQPPFPTGAPDDLTMDGNRASTRIGDVPVALVRENGRWYLARP